MKIEIRDSFLKDIKKLSKENKQKIEIIFSELENAHFLTDVKNIKKLQGFKAFYRVRVGDYRLGFAYEDDVIILLHFLHRKEIYRFFP
ncbi:MAG: type II toxin-antitoxin system RelE/ParE family toxin [Arcobacteraceae bacterium]|jgi:mRNA interferase RelE/StbE|nr:type II toxin-antitoxin system RelE/ParE family toxin [Arcobacteraceae bacterium]